MGRDCCVKYLQVLVCTHSNKWVTCHHHYHHHHRYTRKEILVPVHLYGQLAQHERGIQLLRSEDQTLTYYFNSIKSNLSKMTAAASPFTPSTSSSCTPSTWRPTSLHEGFMGFGDKDGDKKDGDEGENELQRSDADVGSFDVILLKTMKAALWIA
ncbi:hypothetical protein HELRODRAFT_184629, partial [Helobdella robusta]|uniref:Uncharacterized protein n=1 Tax=Helobdella robusta TaxID=6412 RepID=T1FLM3_HELRO